MLTFPLDTKSHTPLYQQIYQTIQKNILDGTLPPSSKLPSTRALSSNLGVSRNTVDTAYYQLQAEGYIDAAPKSGFYVCDSNPGNYFPSTLHTTAIPTSKEPSAVLPMDCQVGAQSALPDMDTSLLASSKTISAPLTSTEYLYDFSPFAIDISHFPFSVWRKLYRQCLVDEQELFLLGDHFGDLPLRQAICDYVRLSREVWCQPEQIIIGAGVDYLLQMLSLVFDHRQLTHITLENPGYMQAAHIFRNNGLSIASGALDTRGLSISSIAPESQIVYVTPSHQFPLGTVMPFGRRKELLAWASSSPDRYIIEDDHDSEFRYKGKPIPSLQGMDHKQRVIYIGTFSKAIAPAIRVGYMILPPSLLPVYHQICGHYSCTVSRLDQAILTHFLRDGYFEKHVNRMRKIYRNKHDLLLSCLQPLIQQYHLTIRGDHAGLHLVIELPENGIPEEELIHRAAQNGIHLYGIGEHYLPESGPISSGTEQTADGSEQMSSGTEQRANGAEQTSSGTEQRANGAEQTSSGRISGILLGYSNLSEEEIKKGICHMADTHIFQYEYTK